MAQSQAQRSLRWRARHRDRVRALQFKVADLEALLAASNERVTSLLWDLKHRNRKDRFQSWIDGQKNPD
jgi:hypothetical protein